MITKEGQLTWAAKRAIGMANSVEANERRRREPPIIDWEKAITNLLDVLDDGRAPTATNRVVAQGFRNAHGSALRTTSLNQRAEQHHEH